MVKYRVVCIHQSNVCEIQIGGMLKAKGLKQKAKGFADINKLDQVEFKALGFQLFAFSLFPFSLFSLL
jgi:hypothetical protein